MTPSAGGQDEIQRRLRWWQGGQKDSERLAAQIIGDDGFQSIDPSHPLGGPDGLKDAVCTKDGLRWILAVHFAREPESFPQVRSKFTDDLAGASANAAAGFVFVTNQHITVGERQELENIANDRGVRPEIYHLERLVQCLLRPALYGVRLEFLDIELSKSELLAYFAARDKVFQQQIVAAYEAGRRSNDAFRLELQSTARTERRDESQFMSVLNVLNLGPGPASNIEPGFRSTNGFAPVMGIGFTAIRYDQLVSTARAVDVFQVSVLWDLRQPPAGWLVVSAETRGGDRLEQVFPMRCHADNGVPQCQVSHLHLPPASKTP